MLHRELLVFTHRGEQSFQFLRIRMWFHADASSSSLLGVMPNASDSLAILSIEMLRSPRSTDPTYVR
jgi:hypothetical protein